MENASRRGFFRLLGIAPVAAAVAPALAKVQEATPPEKVFVQPYPNLVSEVCFTASAVVLHHLERCDQWEPSKVNDSYRELVALGVVRF